MESFAAQLHRLLAKYNTAETRRKFMTDLPDALNSDNYDDTFKKAFHLAFERLAMLPTNEGTDEAFERLLSESMWTECFILEG